MFLSLVPFSLYLKIARRMRRPNKFRAFCGKIRPKSKGIHQQQFGVYLEQPASESFGYNGRIFVENLGFFERLHADYYGLNVILGLNAPLNAPLPDPPHRPCLGGMRNV